MLEFDNAYKKIAYDFIVKNKLSVYLYEEVFALVAKKPIKNGETVIDGGANHGSYTQCFLDCVGTQGKVFSIEAIPALSEELVARFGDNPAYVNVNKALYHTHKDIIDFSWVKNEDHSSAIHLRDFGENKIVTEVFKIETITIDELLKNSMCSFIKLDLEGAEFFALQGGKKTIARHRPIIVFEDARSFPTQWYDYDHKDVFNFFRKHNYLLFSCFAEHLDSMDKWLEWNPWNSLAFPAERYAESSVILESFAYALFDTLLAHTGK